MQPQKLIHDFQGLVNAVEEKSSKYKVRNTVGRDKHTVEGWEHGSFPSNPRDVGRIIGLALEQGIDPSPFQSFTSIYDLNEHLTFEENTRHHPPDLGWLINAHVPPRAEDSEIWDIKLPCPVGIASSPLTADQRWTSMMQQLGYGLTTFKTRRSSYRHSSEAPQIAVVNQAPDLKRYDARRPPQVLVEIRSENPIRGVPNLVNSIGVPSEASPAEWQEQFLQVKQGPVGISVLGEGETLDQMLADLARAVALAAEVDPLFIELNISCPNLKNPGDLWRDLESAKRIVTVARSAMKSKAIRLTLKVPQLPVALMSKVIESVGEIDALTFRNTIRVEPVKHRKSDDQLIPAFQERRFGGLSGPCTFPLTLRAIRELDRIKKKVGRKIPIIAVGGVSSAEDVAQLLNDGAAVVQACTAAMFDPLLAWKTRHQLNAGRVVANPEVSRASDLLLPEGEEEKQAWKNLGTACDLVERKYGRVVRHKYFDAAWKTYKAQIPAYTQGLSQRHTIWSVQQWVKVVLKLVDQD